MGFIGNYAVNYFSVLAGRQPVRPLLFSYYVTHRCSLNCRYCCDGDGKRFAEDPVEELTTEQAKKLVSILSRSADTLDITGGEPLLRDDNLEDVEPLIKLSRELGVTYMVNLYSWNRGTKKPRIPDQQVTEYLLGLKKKYPEFVNLTTYIEHLDQAITEGGIGNCQTGRLLMNIYSRGNVARCTETLDDPVGNILTDGIFELRKKLWRLQREKECAQCWTSCRGFAESMTMRPRQRQFREFYHSVKRHP